MMSQSRLVTLIQVQSLETGDRPRSQKASEAFQMFPRRELFVIPNARSKVAAGF